MIKHIHEKLFKSKSPFAYASVCAMVMGLGDVFNNLTDWLWLIGDMAVQTHPHHWFTGLGLLVSLFLMIGSYIWLYCAINKYLIKTLHKKINKKVKKSKFVDMRVTSK